jgi:hypothetical protein
MKIVWDEPKRIANIQSHDMDFADLNEAFFEDSVIVPAKLGRMAAVGRIVRGSSSSSSRCSAPKL